MIPTDQTNRETRSKRKLLGRIFITVVIKLIEAKIEEIPAKCREKIAKSTEGPAWAIFPEMGGYIVQPVPTPCSTPEEDKSIIKEGGKSQKLMLFKRGNAISGAPNIRGINQLPKPPIITGITKKKIIKRAWAVTIVL